MDKQWAAQEKFTKMMEGRNIEWCAPRRPAPAPRPAVRPHSPTARPRSLTARPAPHPPRPRREAQRHNNYRTDIRLIEARKRLPWVWRDDWTEEEEVELVGMTDEEIKLVEEHTLKARGRAFPA